MTNSTRQTQPEPELAHDGKTPAIDPVAAEPHGDAASPADRHAGETSSTQESEPLTPPARPSSTGPVAGGAVAGAIFGVLSTLGYHHLQAPPVTVADPRLAAIESRIAAMPKPADTAAAVEKTIGERIAKLEQLLAGAQAKAADALGRSEAASSKIAAVETLAAGFIAPVDDRLKQAEGRIEALAKAATQPAVPPALAETVAALGTGLKALEGASGQQTTATGALETRLKGVETALANPAPTLSPVPALHLATVTLLRQSVDNGRPLGLDATTLKGLGLDDAVARPLAAFATRPLPSIAELQKQFSTLAATMPKPQAATGVVAGAIDKMKSSLLNFVEVRRSGTPATPAAAPLAAIQSRIASGDLAGALTDFAARPMEERAVFIPLVKAIEERQAALGALRKLEGDALAAAFRKG